MRVAGTYKIAARVPFSMVKEDGAVLLNEADESDAPGKPPSRQLTYVCVCVCIYVLVWV